MFLYGNGALSRVIQDLILKLGGEVLEIFDHENIYNPNIFQMQKSLSVLVIMKLEKRFQERLLLIDWQH